MSFERRAGTALLFLLLAIGVATICAGGERVPKHVCHFDEINQESSNDYPKTETENENEWNPLRIVISSQDLNKDNKFCDAAGSQRTDAFGTRVDCKEKDVLTSQKKSDLLQVARSGIAMHMNRLMVRRVRGNLVVPEFKSAFCNLFAVPEEHKSAGVANADMMMYVSSFPSSRAEMFAAGAPCALQKSNGRPIAGAFTYVTQHITPTMYSVRVAAHEIAHTLGFTYHMMKNVFNMKIEDRNDVRMKEKVTEVQSPQVLMNFKYHYNCYDGRGMELEDEAGVLNVTSRSHWERRNAQFDLMAGVVTAGKYSPLTLAAFSDMGVYQTYFYNIQTTEWFRYKYDCSFFTQRCSEDSNMFWPLFCVHPSIQDELHCSDDERAMARCSPIVQETSDLPEKYKYFGTNETGEERLLTDRCPIYEEHNDISCTDKVHGSNAIGAVDPQSWCLRRDPNTLTLDSYKNQGICAKLSLNGYEITADVNNTFKVGNAGNTCKYGKFGPNKYFDLQDSNDGNHQMRFLCPTAQTVQQDIAFEKELLQESKTSPSNDDES